MNKVEICGVNTAKLPVLSEKEQRELFARVQAGDREARQEFIYGNLRLVLKFSTYAVPMIIGEIRRYLRDNNPIRVSRSIRDTAYRSLSVKERITAATGKEPTIEEIAKELGITPEEVSLSLDAILDPVSLQEPVYHDGTDAVFVMDQVKDEKNIDDSWLEKISLKEAMKKLGEREQYILMNFLIGQMRF